jgi:hypothetical protein
VLERLTLKKTGDVVLVQPRQSGALMMHLQVCRIGQASTSVDSARRDITKEKACQRKSKKETIN